MSQIRYIIVSDLHLAAANSVLTRLRAHEQETSPHHPSDLLKQLVVCLQHVLSLNEEGSEPVTLILNGDILELALAGTNEAAMTFQGFIELLFDPKAGGQRLAREVFYLPGNHDHHLWNTAKETQFVDKYIRALPPGEKIEPEYYATNMFHDENLKPVPAYLLNILIQRLPALADLTFTTVYPNFALLNSDKTRAVVFHHGQFIEPIYSLMSQVRSIFFPGRKTPQKIWDLEAENGAWIDFFWSTLGRSGEVGEGVALIYDKMQDQQQFDGLLRNLARAIEPKLPWRWPIVNKIKIALLTCVLRHLTGGIVNREVHDTAAELSADAAAGLKHYLEKYVHSEIKRGNGQRVPDDVSFIFGHTHKPFETTRGFTGYEQPIKLLNSGGWVVDTCEPDTFHGGAILLVDDELNAASIRMYNEIENDSADGSPVRVSAAVTQDNPLFERLQRAIKAEEEPWKRFARLVYQAVKDHRVNLSFNIARTET